MEKIDEFIPKDAIGETLLNIMKVNKKIVVLSSDVSESVNIEQIKQKLNYDSKVNIIRLEDKIYIVDQN